MSAEVGLTIQAPNMCQEPTSPHHVQCQETDTILPATGWPLGKDHTEVLCKYAFSGPAS